MTICIELYLIKLAPDFDNMNNFSNHYNPGKDLAIYLSQIHIGQKGKLQPRPSKSVEKLFW